MQHHDNPGSFELAPGEEAAIRDTLEVMVRHLRSDALPGDSPWRDTFLTGALALVKALEPDEPYTS